MKLSFYVIAFLSFQASAAFDPLEILGVTQTSDCGEMSHEVIVDPNDSSVQCLRVYFKNFAVAASGKQEIQRNCHMSAKIRVPAGTRFRATDAVAEGAYYMDGQAYGGLAMTYELPATAAIGTWIEAFRPDTQGDFNFMVKVASTAFTSCQTSDSEIVLSSDLHAFIDSRQSRSSLVSLDETGKRLSWNWKLQPCEPDYFGRAPLTSYYKAPDGRIYKAKVTFSGNRGKYESEAGFTGNLFDFKTSNGGLTLDGKWSASGTQGTFQWKMLDPRTGRFAGTWTDHLGRVGQWWGEY